MTARALGQTELGAPRSRRVPAPTTLNWSSGHTGPAGKCHHCGGETFLRDNARRPSHKVCAETHADRKAARS